LDNKQLKAEKITGSITPGVVGSIVNPTRG
jgi:hypothetical protein